MTNVLIIGLGRHAKRIYVPVLLELKKHVAIVGIIDTVENKASVEAFLKKYDIKSSTMFVQHRNKLGEGLTAFSKKNKVDAVAICTDPEAHVMYAKWALSNGYHVIMDKPIHASPNAAHDKWAARDIHVQYVELLKFYKSQQKKHKGLRCEVLAQRRYHPAYALIKDAIEDVFDQTNCPVTYYYSFHSDGQWRMPMEIETIDYHGFTNGYGKASHSGYHFYDLFSWLTSSCRSTPEVDTLQIDSWANYPSNYLSQLNPEILGKVFRSEPQDFIAPSSNAKLGEVDIFSRILIGNGAMVKTVAEIDLLHSGLSARHWREVKSRDLYKGNGRLRHEQLYISMGPFMSVSLTSWQGLEFGKETQKDDVIFSPGHEFHVDVTIFRNDKLIGGKSVQTYSLKDIYTPSLPGYSRGHQEDARLRGITEFIEALDNEAAATKSSLETHQLSSQIMSSVYESLSSEERVELPLNKEEV